MENYDWGKWADNHNSPEQESRYQKACAPDYAPKSINRTDCSATFWGKSADTYSSSLASCTCQDFRDRQLPCKHMYRLAMELGKHPAPSSLVLGKVLSESPKKSWNWICRNCGTINSSTSPRCISCSCRKPNFDKQRHSNSRKRRYSKSDTSSIGTFLVGCAVCFVLGLLVYVLFTWLLR